MTSRLCLSFSRLCCENLYKIDLVLNLDFLSPVIFNLRYEHLPCLTKTRKQKFSNKISVNSVHIKTAIRNGAPLHYVARGNKDLSVIFSLVCQ